MSDLKLTIKKDKIKDIVSRYYNSFDETDVDFILDVVNKSYRHMVNIAINIDDISTSFATSLFNLAKGRDIQLGPTQLRVLKAKIGAIAVDKTLETKFKSVRSLYNNLVLINADKPFNFLYNGLDRWFPVKVDFSLWNSWGSSGTGLSIKASVSIGENMTWNIIDRTFYNQDLFMEEAGVNTPVVENVGKFLEKIGLNPEVDTFDYDGYIEECEKAARLNRPGHTYEVKARGLTYYQFAWWKSLEEVELNSEVVTEPELEVEKDDYRRRGDSENQLPTPFVRVFSLTMKQYYYVLVEDLKEVKWDEDSLKKLVLPPEMKRILDKMFTTSNQDLATDIVKGNAGGLIMMASGTPGIGKTATAVAYSQTVKRPLYIMEVAELGVNPNEIEERLQKIFMRVQRWNAILLMDEVDIFFAERDFNLERSALVGVFLRILDQFKGILFLTTNRAEVIDSAFTSRITLHLKYPKLDRKARTAIWHTFIEMADIKVKDPENLGPLYDLEYNGREIRNKARIIKVMFDGEKVTSKQIMALLQQVNGEH